MSDRLVKFLTSNLGAIYMTISKADGAKFFAVIFSNDLGRFELECYLRLTHETGRPFVSECVHQSPGGLAEADAKAAAVHIAKFHGYSLAEINWE